MPDHEPRIDVTRITPEQADRIWHLIAMRYQLVALAGNTRDNATSRERLEWMRTYAQIQSDLGEAENDLGQSIVVFPWTVHVAGAPGIDERLTCGHDDCDNPWCGKVQKCARCHDILSFGYSAPGQMSEVMAQMMGGSIQGFMQQHFGENPVDDEGPTWFPVGCEIAKRSHGPGAQMFLMNEKPDDLEPGIVYLDCEMQHEELVRQMRAEHRPPRVRRDSRWRGPCCQFRLFADTHRPVASG